MPGQVEVLKYFSLAFEPPIYVEFISTAEWEERDGPEPYRSRGIFPPEPDITRDHDLIARICIPIYLQESSLNEMFYWKLRMQLRVIVLNEFDEIEMVDPVLLEDLVESQITHLTH